MKKTFITVFVVLLFTLFFVLVFRYTSGASSVDIENGESFMTEEKTESTENEIENASEDTSSTGEAVETSVQSESTENQHTIGAVPGIDNAAAEEEFDISVYLREKIAPVAVGVTTAVITICIAIAPLVKAIVAIRNLIASFSKKDEERNASVKESNEQFIKNVEKIEASVESVPELEKIIRKQNETIKTLSEIIVLGFSSNSEVVRAGKGKKMTLLLNKLDKGEGI